MAIPIARRRRVRLPVGVDLARQGEVRHDSPQIATQSCETADIGGGAPGILRGLQRIPAVGSRLGDIAGAIAAGADMWMILAIAPDLAVRFTDSAPITQ